MYRLEYDLAVLNEIHDQVKDARSSSTDGKGAMERVKQRRNARATASIEDGSVVELLKQRGIPVTNTGE